MLWELLAFGGILFWIIVGVVVLAITALIHDEKIWRAAGVLIVTLAVLALFTNVPKIIATIPPIWYLYVIGGYLIAAPIWAVIKWRGFFLPALFEQYDALRSKFLETAGPKGEPLNDFPADPAVKDKFNNLNEVKWLNINSARMVRRNKARITTWMIYWPFSLLETFLGDFLARVFSAIYKRIAGSLQRMSDRMAAGYSELA